MKNIRYHITNLAAVLLFSYTLAASINSIISFLLQPDKAPNVASTVQREERKSTRDYSYYSVITEKSLFKIPKETGGSVSSVSSPQITVDNLILMGTITGPPVITRAMIMKKGEKNPGIFALWKINDEITNDVYGYKLVRVDSERVTLETNGEKRYLDLFPKIETSQPQGKPLPSVSGGDGHKLNVSRAEIKQQVLNNMDNASKGLVISPYRENGEVVGYHLKKVRPYNILYKYGIRSGDIIRRINGHPMNSMDKFYKMWENLQNESRIVLDVEREGKLTSFEWNITD